VIGDLDQCHAEVRILAVNAADEKRECLDRLERMLTQVPEPEYPFEIAPWDHIRKQLRRGLNLRALASLEYRVRRLTENSYQEGERRGG